MKVNENKKAERNKNVGIRTQKINQQKDKMILSCH